MELLDEVKNKLRPDDSVLIETELFVKEINKEIKLQKIKASCVTGGSVAKGTFLKGDFDVDLFVKFDYSYSSDDLSDMLEKILEKFQPEKVHGSRDYFQLKYENLNYEIVPVLDVKDPEKAKNVTDMSPLHVDWVKKNLKKGQADEIRLAKKFCKAARVYGAESYIRGFSGHVLDVLIINYGSFLQLLKNSQKWKKKTIIDKEKYYRNSQDVLFNINQSKIQGPLIVIDPIQKKRNAASALSSEKFSIFKKKARDFLKKPSKQFFEERTIGKTYLKAKFKEVYVLDLSPKNGKSDVVGSKILKAFRYLKSKLKKRGFEVKKSGWEWNKKQRVLYWFVFKDIVLPEKTIVEGPPVEMDDACRNFKKKYSSIFKRDGRLYAKAKTPIRDAEKNIIDIAESDYFKEKISLKAIEKYK